MSGGVWRKCSSSPISTIKKGLPAILGAFFYCGDTRLRGKRFLTIREDGWRMWCRNCKASPRMTSHLWRSCFPVNGRSLIRNPTSQILNYKFWYCFEPLIMAFNDGVLHRHKSSSLDSKLYQVNFNVHLRQPKGCELPQLSSQVVLYRTPAMTWL